MDSLDLLLKLIRIAIGTESDFSIPIAANWGEVYELSKSQGVCALCADVVGGKSEELGIADDLLYSWIGQAIVQDTEYDYHVETIAKLANLYASEDMGMMVMKGYAASLMYPVPSHRCAGDVDIYLFGKGATGDAWEGWTSYLEARSQFCEEAYKKLFHSFENFVLSTERHFNIQLIKFDRRTVSTCVFISEAWCNLEIFIKAGNHKQLLELLWSLWQCIKFSRIKS